MTKIDELTPAQEARLGEWRDLWIAIGLSTERADFPRAEAALRRCYEYAGLEEPRVVIPVSSPIVAVLAGPIAAWLIERIQLKGAVDGAVRDAVGDAVGGAVKNHWHDYLGGSFWSAWPAWESFFREVCGLRLPGDLSERAEAWAELLRSACWVWPHRSFAMISDRPVHIDRNERGRLHSTTRAAIQWPDGWGVYSVGGVRVDRSWIEERDQLDPKLALTHENAELRRAVAQIVGWDRVLEHAPMTEVSRDQYGVLLVTDAFSDDGDDPARFIRVACTTTGRVYHFRVPPDVTTPRHALGWKYHPGRPEKCRDVAPDWYSPEVES